MNTKRHHKMKNKTRTRTRTIARARTMKGGKGSKTGKKWLTAIDAASETLKKTGSIVAARESLRKQALYNARKLFGSVSK